MIEDKEYLKLNTKSWNLRTSIHFDSEFYDNQSFIDGRNSLNSIELDLLGNIKNKSILHLQCHFGQDTISLSRLGAKSIGVDLSDISISKANELAKITQSDTQFICCDIYDLPKYLDQKFDIVYTSYGTITWLPDLSKWSDIISHFLKPGGEFVFVEFHPIVWMFDDNFNKIKYSYFNQGPIVEEIRGTYTNVNADILQECVMWDHSLSEIFNSLIKSGLEIKSFDEYDYSPYDCFEDTIQVSPYKFRIKHLKDKIPMVFSLKAFKKLQIL